MSSHLLRLYHHLPPPARSGVATLRGWYLQRWRRSADSERLTEEALERERWSPSRWNAWREERLAYVLHRAATQVPFYREHWEARRRRGDQASRELIENWPLLGKDAVRANPRAFLADDCDARRMLHEHTSGTTGTPLEIWRSHSTLTTLYAIADARTRRWDGIPPVVRWARIGGQLVVPVGRRRPPFWVWNAAMRQLYLSSYHLAPDLIPAYLDALARYRIAYIAGYPSSIHALAREVLRVGRKDLRMAAIYTSAEPLLPRQRETIAAAFQCPVRETYGMAETVAAASECSAGRLHQWPEIGHIEVRPDGEFICTGLLNADMPFIRYRVGDRGSRSPEPCPCGRSLPVLSGVEGRVDDLLITRDGRLIGRLDPVFKGASAIREAQIAQEGLDLVRVRVVPEPDFTAAHERMIIEQLHARMGNVLVVIDRVDHVPRTSNGKLRAVICNLTPAERALALDAGPETGLGVAS